MQLRRWHRIGVVLSVLWAVGAAYFERTEQIERRSKFVQASYSLCIERNVTRPEGTPRENCAAESLSNTESLSRPDWANIAFSAFAPILLAWLLVLISIRVYRWIMAGPR